MDAIPFLDYLHDHAATAGLAEALTEIACLRRSPTLRPIPIEVGTRTRRAR